MHVVGIIVQCIWIPFGDALHTSHPGKKSRETLIKSDILSPYQYL